MATARLFDKQGKPAGDIELAANLFGRAPNLHLVHQTVVAELNAARPGTSDTKSRREIAGGGKQTYRQQGVTSQVEEVGLHLDRGEAQQPLPDLGQTFLQRVPWTDGRRLADRCRNGQSLAINLAVRGQRKGVERDKVLRHHVFREAKRKPGPNAGHIQHRGSGQIGYELLRAVAGLADHRDGIGHPRLPSQLRLDVTQFDAKPAQLDLMIDASQKFNRAVGSPFRPVARTIQPGSRPTAEGIGNETLRRRLGSAQIPTRDLLPADVEFSQHLSLIHI